MTPGVVVCWSGAEPRLQTLRIPEGGVVLGRDHASPTDDRISRNHVRVRLDAGAVVVEDTGSRNGTYVQGLELVGPSRQPVPTVIRAGRTVFVVVADVEPFEDLTEGKVGARIERARREIEEAARAEQNVTVLACHSNAKELARRYVETLGGEEVVYEPDAKRDTSLDGSLANTRPRVVVLRLMSCALSFADMPTVSTWLETDVRFVTMMWPGSNAISMIEPAVAERLRERVIEVPNPCLDELPFRVRDIVRELAPETSIHATTIEGMVLRSIQYDEGWVMRRFRDALAAWRPENREVLRFRDVMHDIDPPRDAAHCLVGSTPRRRSSFR